MSVEFAIPELSLALTAQLQAKIDQKTKPLGALGQLEAIAMQIGLIQNTLSPHLHKPCLLVFAGDHGITEAGVSAYPQTVTAQMVANFLAGGAAISIFAKQHSLDLWIIDAGVNADLKPHPRLLNAKIAKGTRNFLHYPAMSEIACKQAIAKGAELVILYYQQNCNCIGFGEMGIGNTSSAALLMHCLTEHPLIDCIGRGSGLNAQQLHHKITVLQQAQRQHSIISNEPLTVLATFGGYEIAMMVGALLQAAALGMVILIDGFITTAALLVASKINSRVSDYCLFSHLSDEYGHKQLLHAFKAKPLLQLNLRLGEGSGVALCYPLLQSAVLFLNEMASFDEAGIDKA